MPLRVGSWIFFPAIGWRSLSWQVTQTFSAPRSTALDISADGRFVAFRTGAPNLLPPPGDTNGTSDVFVHDRDADGDGIFDESGGAGSTVTERVSVGPAGLEANGGSGSERAHMSPDGRFIVFQSDATNLLGPGGDTNGVGDIYLRDRQAGINSRAR